MELRSNDRPIEDRNRGLDVARSIKSDVEQTVERPESTRSEHAGEDRIDLSDAGRLFAHSRDTASEAARAELVDSLRAAYREGNLTTRERIERAAQRLLQG